VASCWDSEEHRDWTPAGTLRSTGTGLLLVPRVITKNGEAAFQI